MFLSNKKYELLLTKISNLQDRIERLETLQSKAFSYKEDVKLVLNYLNLEKQVLPKQIKLVPRNNVS